MYSHPYWAQNIKESDVFGPTGYQVHAGSKDIGNNEQAGLKMGNCLYICLLIGLILLTPRPGAGEQTSGLILATGFEAFGGETVNASWEAVKELNGKQFLGTRVVTAQLPVAWDVAAARLQELIRLHKPSAVICFGQAGAGPVRLETIARNMRDSIRDNKGLTPLTPSIYAHSPPAIETGLSLTGILERLHSAGIPARISADAGTYICNEVFYTLMLRPGTEDAGTTLRGFIHLPPMNAKVATEGGGSITFDGRTLQRSAEVIIRTVIADSSRKQPH